MTTEPTTPVPGDETLPILVEAPTPAEATSTASAPLPRTRWAAIVWGVCFAALAWFGIWMLSGDDRRSDVSDWFASLTPGTTTAMVLLAVGVLVLITGLVGLIRRGQLRRRDRP